MQNIHAQTETKFFDAVNCSLGSTGNRAAVAVEELELAFETYKKQVCREAREILGCSHIVICPPTRHNTLKSEMNDFIRQSKGMAFAYKHVALGHEQPDFNAAHLGIWIMRYFDEDEADEHTTTSAATLAPCRLCTMERFGSAPLNLFSAN